MRVLGLSPTESELESIINEIDEEGNGIIDFLTFKKLMEKKMKPTVNETKIMEAQIYKSESNQYFSKNEISKVFFFSYYYLIIINILFNIYSH